MDENWAAIVVSAITGAFGLLGLIVAQLIAKYKNKRFKPSANDILASSEDTARPSRIDYLAALRHDVKAQQETEREAHRDIKDMIRDMHRDMKDGFQDVSRDIDRIGRN